MPLKKMTPKVGRNITAIARKLLSLSPLTDPKYQKMTPDNLWRPTSTKKNLIINRIPVMVPLTAPLFGIIFSGGRSPSKIIPIAPS
jgi:hypothetical protein